MAAREPVGPVLDTASPPEGARKIADLKPDLLLTGEHNLCPGCGEPLAVRIYLEALQELGVARDTVMVAGIGCYTMFSGVVDLDLVQALHGRAPSVATGLKRMLPDKVVFTLQGDGDMVNEGLQEVLHTAARGERVTCILQVDGKLRDRVEVDPEATEDDLREQAMTSERVRAALGDRQVARVVVVPPKLVNLVTAR